jgi:crossover junction endodeoxyribonuclease RuvC
MRVVGVDPGVNGALAVFDPTSDPVISVFDLPSIKLSVGKGSRTRLDEDRCWALVSVACAFGVDLFVIEDVNGYGEQPGSAGFVFGAAAGLLTGMAVAVGASRRRVPPSVWKKAYGIRGKTRAEKKNASRIAASHLFPKQAHFFARVKDDGRAEAALLSHYAATKILGYVPS